MRKVIPALIARGEDPVQYFLNQKYIEAIGSGLARRNCNISYLPNESANLQIAASLGLNAIPGYALAKAQ